MHYILIYFFIIFHGATIYELGKNYLQPLIELVCILLCIRKKSIRKNSVMILLSILCFLTLLVSYTVGSGTGLTYFRAIADEIIITYVVVFYDKKNFFKRFLKTLSLLAIISLIFFSISLIDSNLLFNLFDKRPGERNFVFYGIIFYSMHTVLNYVEFRNCGIFTEPGIYAVLLISAIYALMFLGKYIDISSKQRYRYFFIFIITILTTLSTIAYIVMGVVIIGYMFRLKKTRQFVKDRRVLVLLCLIFLVTLYINYTIQGDKSIISTYVLNKVDTKTLLAEETSGNARLVTIVTSLSIIAKYPLGAGGNFVVASLPQYAVAAQFLTYIAAMGLVNSTILYLYFLRPSIIKRASITAFITYIIMYIMLSLAQSQVWYPSLLMFPVMWQTYQSDLKYKSKKNYQPVLIN